MAPKANFPRTARPGLPTRGDNFVPQKPTKVDTRTGSIGKKARKKSVGKSGKGGKK